MWISKTFKIHEDRIRSVLDFKIEQFQAGEARTSPAAGCTSFPQQKSGRFRGRNSGGAVKRVLS